MTFIAINDTETFDWALELFYSGDCATLEEVASVAVDMQDVVRSCVLEWDRDVGEAAALAFAATGDADAFDTMVAALPF